MSLDEINKYIKHYNNQIKVATKALEQLYILKNIEEEKQLGQITLEDYLK